MQVTPAGEAASTWGDHDEAPGYDAEGLAWSGHRASRPVIGLGDGLALQAVARLLRPLGQRLADRAAMALLVVGAGGFSGNDR